MGLVFLVILTIAEIALITLTFTKYSENASWLKNRTLVTLVEVVLLLAIIVLPTTYFKWRFAFAMVILTVRLAFEVIRFAVRRKKVSGAKHKAAAIASGVLSIIFSALALVPAFLFTNYNGLETTGEHSVAAAEAILIDKNRKDPFEDDGSFREVPVHFYYPEDGGSYPLVVFSHGAFGYYQSNFSTYMELASNGYVVAALDHPHHAFFTTDTNGETIIVDSQFINDAMTIGGSNDVSEEEIFATTSEWMELRTADENFVLDTIKDTKTSGALDDSWFTQQESDILGVTAEPEQVLHNRDLLGPVATAGLCIIPTCVTFFKKEPTLKQYIARLVIQFVLIEVIMLTAITPQTSLGVSKTHFYIMIAVSIFIIYTLAILIMYYRNYQQSMELTKELIRFQEKEQAV